MFISVNTNKRLEDYSTGLGLVNSSRQLKLRIRFNTLAEAAETIEQFCLFAGKPILHQNKELSPYLLFLAINQLVFEIVLCGISELLTAQQKMQVFFIEFSNYYGFFTNEPTFSWC